jgi:hypothetical protein
MHPAFWRRRDVSPEFVRVEQRARAFVAPACAAAVDEATDPRTEAAAFRSERPGTLGAHTMATPAVSRDMLGATMATATIDSLQH